METRKSFDFAAPPPPSNQSAENHRWQ
jgi:hypothetical protein